MNTPAFDPVSLEYTADPKPFFRAFQDGRRIFRSEALGAWFVHGYEETKTLLTHPDVGYDASLIPGHAEGAAERRRRWPITERSREASGFSDPVKHAQMRKLLAPDFKPSMIRRMAATVHDVVAKHCAPLQSAGEIDVVELVQEVPLTTISRILGLDEESPGARVFLDAAPAYFRGTNPLSPEALRDQSELAAAQMLAVLSEAVEERRLRPREDLISQTLEFAKQFEAISNEDIANLLVILVAAGTDTTRLASSLAVKTLIAHPAARETLRADKNLLDNAFFEFLRFESPTKFLVRMVTADLEVGGVQLPRGAFLMLSPFAAGMDPLAYPDPDVFDPRRPPRGSLSFGIGEHYCLGVHLAKLQVGAIVSFFLDHLGAEATVDETEIGWDPANLFLREITRMPIRLR